MAAKTVRDCLTVLGLVEYDFSSLDGASVFLEIKKAYRKAALLTHPDRGGDAAAFREVQTSFEVLRELSENIAVLLRAVASSGSKADVSVSYDDFFKSFYAPPADWFEEMSPDEPIPIYSFEYAKSGRSRCCSTKVGRTCEAPPFVKDKKGGFIPSGSLRVGSMDLESGAFGRWVHLECWRVPVRICVGLPSLDGNAGEEDFKAALLAQEGILIQGFTSLEPEDQKRVVIYCMDASHYAKVTKSTARLKENRDQQKKQNGTSTVTSSKGTATPTSVVVKATPKSNAVARILDMAKHNFLKGKTVVLTGLFPEVGGGAGLNLGKDRLKAKLTAMGARVTSSVSGKTDMLLAGKDPGGSKVAKARASSKCQLLSLQTLTQAISRGDPEELVHAEPLEITSYSTGYHGNGVGDLVVDIDRGYTAGKQQFIEAAGDWELSCDICSVDCTAESYNDAKSELDFCPKCFDIKAYPNAERQEMGVTVTFKKKKARRR